MTAATIAERVAAGAAWLDANRPGWDQLIDLGRLDMADACLCVLGQVYAAKAAELNEWIDPEEDGEYRTGFCYATEDLGVDDVGLGFNAVNRFDRQTQFVVLGTEWKRLIAARRAGESR